MKQFQRLSKLTAGDRVAVVSPSAGLPGLFPWVQDLGLERLREVFGLVPKEYPTTRQMGSSLTDRARDLTAAFADPTNKAVFASIGGNDQIKLIKHLDPQVFLDNPKPFFGYSDNMHFQNFLWQLGIPSYYGGSIMTQLAMQGAMHEQTVTWLKRALFEQGEFELDVSREFNDEGLDWTDEANLTKTRKLELSDGLFWDGPSDAEGILWGGCVESLIVQATTGKYLPKNEDLDGTVLFLETSEGIPEHWVIEDLLTGFGERGWLISSRPSWSADRRRGSSTNHIPQTRKQPTAKSNARRWFASSASTTRRSRSSRTSTSATPIPRSPCRWAIGFAFRQATKESS